MRDSSGGLGPVKWGKLYLSDDRRVSIEEVQTFSGFSSILSTTQAVRTGGSRFVMYVYVINTARVRTEM